MAFSKIIIDTPQGQYELPLRLVAEDRAKHYWPKHKYDGSEEDWEKDFNEEVEWVMKDNYEAIDWLLNNMDWDDVKDKATKINDKVLVTDEDFWTSSDNVELF